ncbi:DUF1631 family protein [Thermomonas sp.]|uniref:DUF1631 family protein n=1 Tax=Thermomonas sp. TaxID=1971895 RepID=UPI00260703F1|nr:DUF1631 family protein [Thermomonas sp.]MCO5056137.1 DUF1631 domain-containing protein [Thermomonas sp.]
METIRIDSLRNLGSGSPLFIRRFLLHVEESFKSPDSNTTPALTVTAADPLPQTLSLVVDDELDNDGTLLDNIASRLSARNSLALQLLGQRFGVLTRAPAYEAETLPLGLNVLCAGLAKASDAGFRRGRPDCNCSSSSNGRWSMPIRRCWTPATPAWRGWASCRT